MFRKSPIKPTLSSSENPAIPYIGLINIHAHTAWIEPLSFKASFDHFYIKPTEVTGVKHHDVIMFTYPPQGPIQIIERLGSFNDPHMFSLIALKSADVPLEFSQKALTLAQKGEIPPLKNRKDYRDIPLVTIDGADARDFDDAVFATPCTAPLKGWHITVAIADVAYYVRPDDELDRAAYGRGNSVYFPDRVVPMLPEFLSNGLCSLKPDEDRACLAVEMHITPDGVLKSYTFHRGLMRSHARLTYDAVQHILDHGNEQTPHFSLVHNLHGAFRALEKARRKRGALEIESQEYKVTFDSTKKNIQDIAPYPQLTSHKIIEECMILANVAAAKALATFPTLYRVHDAPDKLRIENLKPILSSLGHTLGRTITPKNLNAILNVASPLKPMIHTLVLRAQSQALYTPKNNGHFGLGLTDYVHFTSPIRRYADLVVHRCLIEHLGLGEGGRQALPLTTLQDIGTHISSTERRAAKLERDVLERYRLAYLQDHLQTTFKALIVGVTHIGIFFEITPTGAQGFFHKRDLPGDYYEFDEKHHMYKGKRTKRIFQLGDPLFVILENADVVSLKTSFRLVEDKPLSRKKSQQTLAPKDPDKAIIQRRRKKLQKRKR